MPTFTDRSALADVLAQADARAIVEESAPEVLTSPMAQDMASFPLAGVLQLVLGGSDPRVGALLNRLGELEDRTPRPVEAPPIPPRDDYEDTDVPRGSARVQVPVRASQRQLAEIILSGPSHGNPFVDVELQATFVLGDQQHQVGGFYDGEGRYLLRFLPPVAGEWSFTTTSTARSLDGVTGRLPVEASDAPGVVGVVDTYRFAYADGTPYVPVGTTAYAWIHQDEAVQEETLRSLAGAPFTKIRMTLFPKDFIYNRNEPERFVFVRDGGEWDTTRFDVEFFRHLERRLDELDRLGVQADLILFHPYDRWGFSRLGRAADDRYITYVVRRLAAYPNVWWSMANEYDLLLSKDRDDWDRLANLVRSNDHAGHLLSIHNWVELWDYSSDWATHCSIQSGDRLGSQVREWRARWGKPVVVDECGYEGDLDQGWGSLLAEDLVRRCWEIALSGGYSTHGETYYTDDEVIFWAKGGTLRGESPERLRFLRSIIEASPTRRLEPLLSSFDDVAGGVQGRYQLTYFGQGRPRFRTVSVPEGMRARIDVIDTWNMTIDAVPGEHAGSVKVDLPARPYIAIRVSSTD